MRLVCDEADIAKIIIDKQRDDHAASVEMEFKSAYTRLGGLVQGEL